MGLSESGVGGDTVWAAGRVNDSAWDGEFVEEPEDAVGARLGEVVEGQFGGSRGEVIGSHD